MDKTVVFLTGFGPFEGHETNASWEAVKLVPTLNTEEELSIKLFVEQLPVVYSSIEKLVPELKLAYKPDVTIHVGVYNGRGIRIEEFAKKKGYTKNDIIDNCPKGGICSTGSDDVLCTQINLPLLSRTFFNETKQPIYISKEAGKYVLLLRTLCP
ncbi:hypothetical protein AAG570_013234 [Ranatra chinensis]|uniref:Pyroglutamyl-peptidase I n=1 Tax=Ranatra chinensis TaxID=642074 RepID=A0ABD0YGH2_9HEMI